VRYKSAPEFNINPTKNAQLFIQEVDFQGTNKERGI